MPSTRRQVLVAGTGLLAGLSGCSVSQTTNPLEAIHIRLWNRTDTKQTFHFVLDADGTLGSWQQFSLTGDENRVVTLEPATDQTWTGYHAIAGEVQDTGSLLGQATETQCLQIEFEIRSERILGSLSTAEPLCEE